MAICLSDHKPFLIDYLAQLSIVITVLLGYNPSSTARLLLCKHLTIFCNTEFIFSKRCNVHTGTVFTLLRVEITIFITILKHLGNNSVRKVCVKYVFFNT